jgi:two-component system sensor histidine kinase/response regulator
MQEKGSGLGLKLCKEFLTINKGGIKVYGKKDEGTRVRFYLPLCTVADKKLQESRVDEEELV